MKYKYASLTPDVLHIVRDKGTERSFSGKYLTPDKAGSFLCRACGLALFRADSQFASSCGWPSFDEALQNNVQESRDADGRRNEITCARCQAHLGHVFTNEAYTAKNIRHCVNSLAIEFVENKEVQDSQEAIVAGGCFWGVEYFLRKLPGVLKTEVGYCGGLKTQPTYEEVCQHNTGHLEACRVVFDPKLLSYETLLRHFFEIHDPTQKGGQGPDLGPQYESAVFYYDENQKEIAQKCLTLLQNRGFSVKTALIPVSTFWPAEGYHQDYYHKKQGQPYCHVFKPRFE